MSRILFLGATSPIARALVSEFADGNASLYLGARDLGEAERIAADIRVRSGAKAFVGHFDATDFEGHDSFLRDVTARLGGLDGVVLCFGALGDQKRAEASPTDARRLIDDNLTGAVSLLTIIANHLESQGSGFIITLGSVAGERGRRPIYVYGAAKAGLAVFMQGLRSRLGSAGVHVMTVKLGQVDTRMTYGKERLLMVASPQVVARQIHSAWKRGAEVVYVPKFWRPLMAAIRMVPERFFKRLNF